MAELAQVRIHLKRTSKVFEHSAARYAAPGILSGAIELMPIPRILRQLPPRHICDKLINIFFTKLDPALSILHQPSFRQVYEDFWLHKASTSPIWLAILCTAPRIAVHICIRDDSSPPELEGKCANLTVQLRSSAAQCLQYADYSRPQEGVIEALILAQYADYASSRDINPSVWVMHGLIIRLSVTMGYHLDSEAIPGVSAFQLEMRRRCWTFIRFADILFSFQLGYPSTLHPRWLDAPLPRNLNDTEFDRHPRELPPSLPANGVTSASVLVSKARLSIGFAQAVQGSSKAPMYNDQGIAGHEYALEDMMQTDFDTSLFGFDLADPAAFVSGIYSGI